MSWLEDFPALGAETLSALRRAIDGAFRGFTREYGEVLERLFDPLREFLLFSERLLTQSPWPVVIGVIALIAWFASRSWKIVAGTVFTLLAIGLFGMWDDTMKTVSMIFVCTVVALVLGVPIGVLASRSDRLQRHDHAGAGRDADHAQLRLPDPGGDAAGHRPRAGRDRGGDLRHPAGDPLHQPGH
ncbi:MAG: hypothetical protein KDG57_15560, partial [Rhodoferax sp.]|nr:hypothetical protein [Rhodoferax sp.]